MSVRRAKLEIDSAEFTDWIAFHHFEPWGSDIDDRRAGVVASAIYNVHRDPKRRRKAYNMLDFLPWRAIPEAAAPTLLSDKDAQSNLIAAALFGKAV